MKLHLPISEDLISILDRVLEKSIVVESWIHIGLEGSRAASCRCAGLCDKLVGVRRLR